MWWRGKGGSGRGILKRLILGLWSLLGGMVCKEGVLWDGNWYVIITMDRKLFGLLEMANR